MFFSRGRGGKGIGRERERKTKLGRGIGEGHGEENEAGEGDDDSKDGSNDVFLRMQGRPRGGVRVQRWQKARAWRRGSPLAAAGGCPCATAQYWSLSGFCSAHGARTTSHDAVVRK